MFPVRNHLHAKVSMILQKSYIRGYFKPEKLCVGQAYSNTTFRVPLVLFVAFSARAVASSIIEGLIFIYSCSVQLISFEIDCFCVYCVTAGTLVVVRAQFGCSMYTRILISEFSVFRMFAYMASIGSTRSKPCNCMGFCSIYVIKQLVLVENSQLFYIHRHFVYYITATLRFNFWGRLFKSMLASSWVNS